VGSFLQRWCTTILLILAIGGHWSVLQSVGWVNMLVTYSQEGTFKTAVAKTFDGQHPCNICLLVAKGKKAEQKQSASVKKLKMDLLLVESARVLISAPQEQTIFKYQFPSSEGIHGPPSPPPRSA
jgi:hypothetical protein